MTLLILLKRGHFLLQANLLTDVPGSDKTTNTPTLSKGLFQLNNVCYISLNLSTAIVSMKKTK